MAQGYDQFFKNAKNQKTGGNQKKAAPQAGRVNKTNAQQKASPSNPSPREETAEEFLRRALAVEEKQNKKKRGKPIGPWGIAMLVAFVSCATLGYVYPDQYDQYFRRLQIEIGILSSAEAQAQAAEKAAETNAANQAKDSTSTKDANAKECVEMKGFSEEELSHFNKLNERKKDLDLREGELSMLEEELHKQKAEIETRIQKLEQIREEVASVLKERVEVDQARVGTLVDFYSNMKPKQAAEIFAKLNEDLAVEVLGKMKKKSAADILNLLEPTKARALSEKFTGYQRR